MTADRRDRRRRSPAPTGGRAPPPRRPARRPRPADYFHVMDGTVPAVDGVSLLARPRARPLGHRRRVRLRQERDRADDHAAARHPAGRDRRRARSGSTAASSCRMPIDEMRKLRGNDMAMIFQEPLTSLNPVFTVGDQIAEQVELHLKVSKKEAWDRAIEVARAWSASRSPERRVKQYPHEMSGGMRQRVMIAMALSLRAEAAHRRRADDRARRDDPGPDPGAAQGDPGADRTRRCCSSPTTWASSPRWSTTSIVMYAGPGRGAGDRRGGAARAHGTRTRWASRVDPDRREARRPARRHQGRRARRRSTCRPACRFEPRCPYAWEACCDDRRRRSCRPRTRRAARPLPPRDDARRRRRREPPDAAHDAGAGSRRTRADRRHGLTMDEADAPMPATAATAGRRGTPRRRRPATAAGSRSLIGSATSRSTSRSTAGILRRQVGDGLRRRRRRLRHPPRRDLRPGRRVRLRQDDAGPDAPPPASSRPSGTVEFEGEDLLASTRRTTCGRSAAGCRSSSRTRSGR